MNHSTPLIANTNHTHRMQADVEHFRTKLSKIEGATEVGDKLLEVVRAKPITITNEPAKSETSEKQPEQDDGTDSTKS